MTISFNQAWVCLLSNILTTGIHVEPRGKLIKELPQQTLIVDMKRPVLTHPERKLSFKGMAAEAYWICCGYEQLISIEPWLPRMREFSDDGVVLAGAYGPRFLAQLNYVVEKLREDPDTRQATMTLWNRNPGPSKDIPCTVAIDFKLRDGKLNAHVFMRSSDAWLGIPYDVFSFSMMTHLVCCQLNSVPSTLVLPRTVEPGTLYLTAASSHLYEDNWPQALSCLYLRTDFDCSQYPTPTTMYTYENQLFVRLAALRDTGPGDILRWWESGQ